MIRIFTLFFLFILSNSLFADAPPIYKWTDSNGDTHFSDKPHDGAEEITLPKVQTYSTPKIPPIEETPSEPVESDDIYDQFKILQPTDQLTVRNTQGFVPVILDVKPQLKKGDELQLIIDGNSVGSPQQNTIFSVNGLERGSHTIAAKVVNAAGKTIKTTDTITIFMQPPRIGMGKGAP